ncbi:GrpB family protein [Micromonospora arborensis]|uniref:GrpB family protein n=1 Tax=Micromonospora arborensis TaxID=2116518 RepID=UPI0037168501
MLTAELQGDPLAEWLVPEPEQRTYVFRRLLRIEVDHAIERRSVDVLVDMSGVMIWRRQPAAGGRILTDHHLVPTGSPRYVNVLAFRDYLRAHPDARADYEALKRDLADRYPNDREAYTEGKTDLIGKLTEAAGAWATTRDMKISKPSSTTQPPVPVQLVNRCVP